MQPFSSLIIPSHHPPVTAYCIDNRQHGVRLQGYNAQKASFGRTINVKQVGHAVLHLDAYNEDYVFTLPAIHIEGLISGSPFVELEKSTYIVSSSGYTSRIDYSGKGWVSGKKNSFSAVMHPHGREKDILYTVDGRWSDSFTIKDAHKNVVVNYDAKTTPKTALTVKPLAEQDPLESRKAWKKVADAIVAGDLNTTGTQKTIIENYQRDLRKKEKEQGVEWERTFFTRMTRSPVLETLFKDIPGVGIDADQTNGIWEFDERKAAAAKPPYSRLSQELAQRGGWS